MKRYASVETPQPRGSAGSAKRFSPDSTSASDMLKCAPVPVRFEYGFGMNVTSKPCRRATVFIIIRQSVWRSAIDMTSV
jgi:hypothetical protein